MRKGTKRITVVVTAQSYYHLRHRPRRQERAAGVRRETAMSRVYKQPRPESNKKAAPVTETKDTGSAGKGKKNTEKVEEGGE